MSKSSPAACGLVSATVGGSRAAIHLQQRRGTQEDPTWTSARFGVLQALFFSFVFAFAFDHEMGPERKTVQLAGLVLVTCILHAAFYRPERLPLLAAAYLPFNVAYPFLIPGVTGANMSTFLLVLLVIRALRAPEVGSVRASTGWFESVLALYGGLALLGHIVAWATYSDMTALDFAIRYKTWASPMILYFAVRRLLSTSGDRRALLMVICGTAVFAGLGCWHYSVQNVFSSIEKSRVSGIMEQPNSMGAFLVYYGLPLFAVFLLVRNRRVRLVAAAGMVAIAKGVLVTFSRGATLAFGIGIASQLLLRGPLYLVGTCVGYGLVAMVVPSAIPESVVARMSHTTKGGDSAAIYEGEEASLDKSTADRLKAWRAARAMIEARPLLGVGLGRFLRHVGDFHEDGATIDAHNAYLREGAELGLPALGCMIVLLLGQLARGYRLYRAARAVWDRTLAMGLFGTVLGVMVSSMFGSRFSDEGLISSFWMMAGVAANVRGEVLRRARPQGSGVNRQRGAGRDQVWLARPLT